MDAWKFYDKRERFYFFPFSKLLFVTLLLLCTALIFINYSLDFLWKTQYQCWEPPQCRLLYVLGVFLPYLLPRGDLYLFSSKDVQLLRMWSARKLVCVLNKSSFWRQHVLQNLFSLYVLMRQLIYDNDLFVMFY